QGNLQLIINADNYRQKVMNVAAGKKEILDIALEKFDIVLKEVTVNAQPNPRSAQQSRLTEQNAMPLVDIASGDLIEQSGSISAGDVVQHIQGLSVTRTNT